MFTETTSDERLDTMYRPITQVHNDKSTVMMYSDNVIVYWFTSEPSVYYSSVLQLSGDPSACCCRSSFTSAGYCWPSVISSAQTASMSCASFAARLTHNGFISLSHAAISAVGLHSYPSKTVNAKTEMFMLRFSIVRYDTKCFALAVAFVLHVDYC